MTTPLNLTVSLLAQLAVGETVITALVFGGVGAVLGIFVGQSTDKPTGNVLAAMLLAVVAVAVGIAVTSNGAILVGVTAGAIALVLGTMFAHVGSYAPQPQAAERHDTPALKPGTAGALGTGDTQLDARRLHAHLQANLAATEEAERLRLEQEQAENIPPGSTTSTAERLSAVAAYDLTANTATDAPEHGALVAVTEPDTEVTPDPAPEVEIVETGDRPVRVSERPFSKPLTQTAQDVELHYGPGVGPLTKNTKKKKTRN